MTRPDPVQVISRHFETMDDLKSCSGLGRRGIELRSIEEQAETSILALEVADARAVTCKACRENQWYECDVPDGWSPNCALLRSHQVTGFGELEPL
jgi:hypothetical protein